MIQLEGKKVLLRSIRPDDASEEYISWLNDNEVRRGLESPPPKPYTMPMLTSYLAAVLSDENNCMLAIIDKENNKHIGNCKLHNFNLINKTCELGIMIGNKEYWGKGFGREVCEALILYAFDELKIRKVWLTVHANNSAAMALYKKLAFVEEGRLKAHTLSDGVYVDKLIMSLFSSKS